MTQIRILLNNRAEVYKKDLDREMLFQIITNMRNLQLSHDVSKKLSREFLEKTETNDLEEIFMSLKILGKNYPEARNVYIKYIEKYLAEKKNHYVAKVSSHLAKQEIQNALKTAKGGTR